MKNFRIKLFSLIAVFAISVFGFAGFISAQADDPPAQPAHSEEYNTTVAQFAALNFKMNGASVRKNTFPGIRFEATLDKTQWDAILAKNNATGNNGTCQINETGLLLIPSDYLKPNQELTIGTIGDKFLIGISGVMLLPLEPVLDEDEGVYKLKGGISPIDSELYDKQFTARGYIQYTLADNSVEEKNNFKYADMVVDGNNMSTRSLNKVTEDVLADTDNGLDETEISFVRSIQNRTFSAPEQKVYNVGETIDLSGLNSAATNPYESYYVSVKGGNYTSVTSPYTFAESGRHKFRLQEASGTSDSFVVDAISPETKYDVFNAEDLLATLKYGGKLDPQWNSLTDGNTQQINEAADPDGDGVSERMFTYSPNHTVGVDGTVIQGRPVYSKAYYQKLSDDFTQEGIVATLDFSYYFIKDNNESVNFTEYNTFTNHGNVYWVNPSDTNYVNHWVTETITLEQFISLYDNLYKGYIWEKNNVRSRLVTYKTVTADEDVDYLMNFYHDNGFNLYIRDMKLNVPDADLDTVLADRNTLTEVDLSGNTKLIAAKELYDNPELTLVSRYGNKTIAFANDKFTINNDVNSDSYMEDGLYYLKGTKNGEECFRLAIDIYDSTKPVEVESFGHKDSKDAVSVYYIKESAFSITGAVSAKGYLTQSMFDFDSMSSDDYLKLDFDNNAHGLSLGNATLTDKPDAGIMHSSIYGEGNLTDVPCLTIDESKFTTEGPLAIDNKGFGWYDGVGADLYIYVLPRHSKKYYEKYRDENISNNLGLAYKYGFSYTGGYNNGWYVTPPGPDNTWYAGQFFGYVSGITENNQISFVNSNMTWFDWPYTDAAVDNLMAKESQHVPTTNLTIDEFINHYDAFASGKVWSYKLIKPSFNPKYKEKDKFMGECATYTAKMFGITFTRKGKTAAPTPTTPAE